VIRLLGILIISCVFTKASIADLNRESYRAAEMQAMGNAGIAMLEDEHSLYMNPAGLAGVSSPAFHLVQVDGSVTEELVDSINAVKTLRSPTGSELTQFFGKNLSAQARVSSSLIVPNFGLGGFYAGEAGLYAANPSIPKVEFTAIRTSGIQAGLAVSSHEKFRVKRPSRRAKERQVMQSEWRVGLAVKSVRRIGRSVLLPVVSLSSLDADTIKGYVNDQGSAFGADLGFQFRQPVSPTTAIYFGAALQDVGDTAFAGQVESQQSNLSIGTGIRAKKGPFSCELAYDMRQVLTAADWRKKQHTGVKCSASLIEVFGGLNQFYPAYGFAVDLGIVRAVAYSIKEEAGVLLRQDPERRYGVRVEIKLPL